jgi:hypothetical protein
MRGKRKKSMTSIKGKLLEPENNALYSLDLISKINNLYNNIPKHIDGLFLFRQLSLMLSEEINDGLKDEIKKRKLSKRKTI